MKELSLRLLSISRTDDQALLDEARKIMTKLKRINLRWNIAGLDEFIRERQKELFFR